MPIVYLPSLLVIVFLTKKTSVSNRKCSSLSKSGNFILEGIFIHSFFQIVFILHQKYLLSDFKGKHIFFAVFCVKSRCFETRVDLKRISYNFMLGNFSVKVAE